MSTESQVDSLACPRCAPRPALERISAKTDEIRGWTELLQESQPVSGALGCASCGTRYPITHDGIPVLWSDALQGSFVSLSRNAVDRHAPSESDVKAANIRVYEDIIAEYDGGGIHADVTSRSRLHSALSKVGGPPAGCHLDVGCGGGNTLAAFDGATLTPKIGIDISLKGLRLTKAKGFYAVLGDAEALPIRSESVALITASSVLHHLFAPGRLASEAQRVLQADGLFFTDFDPSRAAANWSWMVRTLYEARLPVYRVLAKFVRRKKVGHSSREVQAWNRVAEYHNAPGRGFSEGEMEKILRDVGLTPEIIFLHNSRTATSVSDDEPIRPVWQHIITQALSGRNPYERKNCDTLLTVSRKRRQVPV